MELGYDKAGTGPTLVLIHGFPFDRRMWSNQLDELSEHRTVVAPDLRGRGLSPAEAEEGWTLDDYADDVARLIHSLGDAVAVDVGGLSMGGYIAFALIRRHPALVRSLVLMSTRAEADTPDVRKAREEQAELVRAEGTGALAEKLIPRLLGPDAPDAVRGLLEQMFDDTPGATAAADLIAMRDRPDSTPDLGSIAVPTLVLHGDDDAIAPVDSARAMAGAIPGAHFASIPGGGHLTPLGKPVIANAAIGAFLRSTDGPA
jgi:3-oxoadipate enol-lactonase